MKISESLFKKCVLRAFSKKKIRIIDLRSGTFDLFIDEGKRLFLELKIANMNYKPFAKNIGINLSPQTEALRIINKLPIVLACNYKDIKECYLIFPNKLKELIINRRKYPTLAIGLGNAKKVLFKKAINLIIKEIRA